MAGLEVVSLRTTTLVLSLLLMGTAVTFAAPQASAFGWCSAYLDNGPGSSDCGGYALCVGYTWDSRGFRCQYGVPGTVCDIIYCGPGPVLP